MLSSFGHPPAIPPRIFCPHSGSSVKKKRLNGGAEAENKLLGYKHGTLILNALCQQLQLERLWLGASFFDGRLAPLSDCI